MTASLCVFALQTRTSHQNLLDLQERGGKNCEKKSKCSLDGFLWFPLTGGGPLLASVLCPCVSVCSGQMSADPVSAPARTGLCKTSSNRTCINDNTQHSLELYRKKENYSWKSSGFFLTHESTSRRILCSPGNLHFCKHDVTELTRIFLSLSHHTWS